jgi:hypothetical protein
MSTAPPEVDPWLSACPKCGPNGQRGGFRPNQGKVGNVYTNNEEHKAHGSEDHEQPFPCVTNESCLQRQHLSMYLDMFSADTRQRRHRHLDFGVRLL